MKKVTVIYNKTTKVPMIIGTKIVVGVYATEDLVVGSMSLGLGHDFDNFKATKVTLTDTVGGELTFDTHEANPNVGYPDKSLTIGWFSTEVKMMLQAGKKFMDIEFECLTMVPVGVKLKLDTVNLQTTEFAAPMSGADNEHYTTTIKADLLQCKAATMTQVKTAFGYVTKAPIGKRCPKCKNYGNDCKLGGFKTSKTGGCNRIIL